MTIKGPSRKQVIIPMNEKNKTKFIKALSAHITNLNWALKDIKLDVMADFVYSEQTGIIIITNKVVSSLNLQTIEKYVKNINHINVDNIKVLQLPQSKSYLKIIDIPYIDEKTNVSIIVDVVQEIIKSNHIFNNIMIASKSYIIKISPKSDMVII